MAIISKVMEFQNLNNTRDLGGMIGWEGKRIKEGMLLRSGQLYPAGEEDLKKLGSEVSVFIDFRTDRECEEKPDPVLSGVEYYHLSAFRSLTAGVTREKKTDEKAFGNAGRDPSKAIERMSRVYMNFVADDNCLLCYRKFIDILLCDHDKAVLWHCTAGKDRTGFAAALIQEILGVAREDILADYLRTNECLREEVEGLVERIMKSTGVSDPGTEKTLKVMFGACEEYLDAVYKKAEELYGSFSAFISNGLKVTPEETEKLRSKYLE